MLEPLGPVKPIGEIIYKIKNVKVNKIRFKIVAVNSNIDRKAEKEIIVNNFTYDEIYKEAYDAIKVEVNSKVNNKKSDYDSDYNYDFSKDNFDSWGEMKGLLAFISAIIVLIFIFKVFK